MKSAFIFFFLLPCLAFAEGYSGASGVNKRGEIISIGDDGGDLATTIYVFEKNAESPKLKERYILKEECPSFFGNREQFSCRKDGKSPLAGTTYRVTTSEKYRPCGDEFPGEVYVCIEGCNSPRAPEIFHVNPWECTP
jgi:hypothetical protein